MDRLGFNSGNSGILESTRKYSGMTWGSYRNDLGMTWEYLGDSGRVWDMTEQHIRPIGSCPHRWDHGLNPIASTFSSAATHGPYA